MNKFKIVPLAKAYVDTIKTTMTDDFGNPVIEQVATGLGPCRISLRLFEKGVDKRLLFKHSPFELENAYNQPGPVFINAGDVEEYSDIFRFPPLIKANKQSFPLSLIGYNKRQIMVLTRLVGNDDVDLLIGDIFEQHQEVEYLHARNAQACCFICKIERL
ncbi:DUF1203 domain-containing protein [Mucilaginibacter flavus]|uniref:DUF1203 domain-containing protein n=1 Tax=Mucilaginibacter flavus TaxID=931504 RepID=UPI0025B2D9BB|nr:DUF1203 domain-containing protein [Mucilaginibacter flavus]MDN3581226.1 DUF1203 domain-containing protein [Mucilaginibacter flavus]